MRSMHSRSCYLALIRWPTPVNQISDIVSTVALSGETSLVSPEWKLLLASAPLDASERRLRGSFEKAAVESRAVEWESLLRIAEEHGLSSLLYQNLSRISDLVPSPVLATLRQRYASNVHKSLFLARELIRVLDCLEELGIEALSYKGVAL